MAKTNSIVVLVFLFLTFVFSVVTIAMVGNGYHDIKQLENVIEYMGILNLKDANIKGSAAGVLVVAVIAGILSLVAFVLTLLSSRSGSSTGKPKMWGIILLVISLLWIIALLAFSIIAGTKRFEVGQGKNYGSLLTGSGGSTTSSVGTLRNGIVIGSRNLEGEKRDANLIEVLTRDVLARNMNASILKRSDDDDEDNDDDSSTSDSTSTSDSSEELGSTITDSGIYNSGSGVSNAYSSAQPKYIEVRVSKRIIGVGWVAFALTTITGFLLLLLPLGTPGHHTTETHDDVVNNSSSKASSPEMASRERIKDPEA